MKYFKRKQYSNTTLQINQICFYFYFTFVDSKRKDRSLYPMELQYVWIHPFWPVLWGKMIGKTPSVTTKYICAARMSASA